jgi:glycosyltransferase involved in cell wall biosynthesis
MTKPDNRQNAFHLNKVTVRPLVSVIVTVYNREKYLAACLDSVLASTWTDYEVIVVDDLSSDNSAEIAAAYTSQDSRVYLHQNPVNL